MFVGRGSDNCVRRATCSCGGSEAGNFVAVEPWACLLEEVVKVVLEKLPGAVVKLEPGFVVKVEQEACLLKEAVVISLKELTGAIVEVEPEVFVEVKP